MLAELKSLDRRKDEMIQKGRSRIRELDAREKYRNLKTCFLIQVENEWKEALYQWNENTMWN